MGYKRFRIGIDSLGCNHGMSGTGAYLCELVANMPQGDFEACVFGYELDKYTYLSSSANVTFNGINIKDTKYSEILWHKTQLNSFIRKSKFDALLYVSGFSLLPLRLTIPSFLIVNDTPKDKGIISSLFIKNMIGQITGIVVPSKYVKDSLLSLGIPPCKIEVIRNGVNTNIFKPSVRTKEEVVFVQPFSIKRPYIIYASSLSNPYKAHIELIKAFNIFKSKTSSPHRLVIAGAEGEVSSTVRNEVIHSHYSQDILLTGYFPHESLSKLYAGADMAIFPSRNEGSALAVLEAIASGVPTACSNKGALKEILDDCSIYFDSTVPEEIASAIERLIPCDENEGLRKSLIEKGFECVSQYSWKKTAEQTFSYIIKKL